MNEDNAAGESAFGFTGDWREFAPIAFTNLLLTIVTLGIYHFWAKTRVRRYLWSNTRFIDDTLEWTGTGLELFIGYIFAIVLFILPIGFLNLLLQGVLLRGHQGAAVLIGVSIYLAVIYLFGVAIFRALRYRLSRTYWRGINGGSDDQGFRYGVSYFWRTLCGMFAAGLMIPWSMTTLWNRRWGRMSFGPLRFSAKAEWGIIFPKFLLFYLTPIVLLIAIFVIAAIVVGAGAASGTFDRNTTPGPGTMVALIAFLIGLYVLFFGVLGLVAMVYYSAFYREAIGKLKLGDLEFGFDATTMDWIKLYLGNIGLAIVTLGLGYIFWPYRNWAFFARHAQAYGAVHLDDLTRSTARAPTQGEGMLDAFDIGAF